MSVKSAVSMGKVVRPKSLTDLAVDTIRSEIVEGRLELGEQLSESQLAADLGISKTPVREALFQLKLQGLVDVHPQRGTFVFQLSEQDVHEICSFREVIESAALARAMETSHKALVTALQSVLDMTEVAERSHDYAQLPRLDAAFHEAFLAHAGSAYLSTSYNLISYKIQALRSRLPEHDPEVDACNHNHALIVSEIARGNVERAQEMLREHIRDTQQSYISASKRGNVLAA